MQIKIVKIYCKYCDVSSDDCLHWTIRLHTVNEITDFEECSQEDYYYIEDYVSKYNRDNRLGGYQYVIIHKDSPAFVKSTVAEVKKQMKLEEEKRKAAEQEELKRREAAKQKRLLKKKESLMRQLNKLNKEAESIDDN